MIKNRQLSFMSACHIGESLIAIDEFGKGIFRIDKKDMSTHLLDMLPSVQGRRNVYQSAELFNSSIFFFPFNFVEGEVVVYHFQEHCVEYINLQKLNDCIQGDYKPAQRVGNDVWLFPTEFTRGLVIFHLETKKAEVISQWKSFMQDIAIDGNDPYRKISDLIEVQNTVYYTVKKTNCIIATNKNTYESKQYRLSGDRDFSVISDYDGQRLWIIERNNKGIISWDPYTESMQEYSMKPIYGELQCGNWVRFILCGKRYLWFIPVSDNKIIKMNYETGEYECVTIACPEFVYSEKGNGEEAFYTIERKENIADIYPFRANRVIHIDLENDILLDRYEQILLPSEWSDQDIIDYDLLSRSEYESNRVSKEIYMGSFFDRICKRNDKKVSCISGEAIWKYISGE